MEKKFITSWGVSSLFLLSFLVLPGCGNDSGGGNAPVVNSIETTDGSSGLYQAVLRPLNTTTAGSVSGTVLVRVSGDDFIVEGAIAGTPAGIKHFQYLTDGASCPDQGADANQDGHVDAVEGMSAYGKALIPLDSNLNSQLEGSDFGPIANPAGAIVYRRTASVSKLLSDLMDIDPETNDHLLKLSEPMLQLSGKKIVIHGVSAELPSTVTGLGELSAAESLPIACGELVRISGEEGPTDLPEAI